MATNFFWYELMTPDPEAAAAFYAGVVGWEAQAFGGGMDYTIMNVGDRGVAGIMGLPEPGAQAGWFGYIYAGDVDAATEDVSKAGGSVLRVPDDIPDVGRFSVVADPQGAVFMLMTPWGPDQPPAPHMTTGHVGWHELMTDDWKAAFRFYSGQFGWEKVRAVDMGEMGTYQTFGVNGEAKGGIMNRPPHMPAAWGFYFTVEGINEAARRVTENDGRILMGPMEVPDGSWVVNCADPQGAHFSLISWKK